MQTTAANRTCRYVDRVCDDGMRLAESVELSRVKAEDCRASVLSRQWELSLGRIVVNKVGTSEGGSGRTVMGPRVAVVAVSAARWLELYTVAFVGEDGVGKSTSDPSPQPTFLGGVPDRIMAVN